jgi:hypothetical protein
MSTRQVENHMPGDASSGLYCTKCRNRGHLAETCSAPVPPSTPKCRNCEGHGYIDAGDGTPLSCAPCRGSGRAVTGEAPSGIVMMTCRKCLKWGVQPCSCAAAAPTPRDSTPEWDTDAVRAELEKAIAASAPIVRGFIAGLESEVARLTRALRDIETAAEDWYDGGISAANLANAIGKSISSLPPTPTGDPK